MVSTHFKNEHRFFKGFEHESKSKMAKMKAEVKMGTAG
jgi:hypothetical protein